MTNRQAVEAKALELYPALDSRSMPSYVSTHDIQERSREAWVQGRTITAEELEAAARGLFLWDTEEHPEPRPTWRDLSEAQKGIWRSGARAAFEAAGFIVESGE